MTTEELESHFRSLGWTVDQIMGADRRLYTKVVDYVIPVGKFTGKVCSVAIPHVTAVPYVFPPSVHVSPHLVPMDLGRYRTRPSPVGPGWQYFSRVLRGAATPRNVVAHLATIFREL